MPTMLNALLFLTVWVFYAESATLKATAPCLVAGSAMPMWLVRDGLAPAIKKLIQTNSSLLPAFLRLAFHDCAGSGGCDGCINTALVGNAGLDIPVRALEALYKSMSLTPIISRADLWALAGIVAVNMALNNKAPQGYVAPALMIPSNFKFGRADCATTPFSPDDKESDFPSGFLNSAGVQSYFSSRFQFNADQTVAIMGAHSLGRMRKQVSGFDGPWVQGSSSGTLDGAYYRTLSNAAQGWRQRMANCSVQPILQQVQWADQPGAPCINMLNADMALYKDIGPVMFNGAVECTYSTCPMASTAATVTTFATNTNTFQQAFAAAFDQVLSVCSRTTGGDPQWCTLTAVV